MTIALESRRKLERQVKTLKAENEDLIQQLVGSRSDSKEQPPQTLSPSMSWAAPSVLERSRMPRSMTVFSQGAMDAVKVRSDTAESSDLAFGSSSSFNPMQSFLAADLDGGTVRQGWGVAWQPLDGTL